MKNQNETQNKAATTVGFIGLLLGILVNTLSAIELDEYEILNLSTFIIGFFVAICCLIMSALTALVTHLELEEDYREKLLDHSQYWLVGGLGGITAAIPAILFKTNSMALIISYFVLIAGLIVAFIFEFMIIPKVKLSQSQSTLKSDDDTQPKDL